MNPLVNDSRPTLNRSLALSCVLLACACGDGDPLAPAPTVATAEPIRGALTLQREGHEEAVHEPTRVESAATVTTGDDARGALRHDGGAWVLMDRSTTATPTLDEITLEGGRLFVDARDAAVIVRTAQGEIRASDATFAIDAREGTFVYCGSGEVTWLVGDVDGHMVQGEELTMDSDPAPEAATLWDDWTGGLSDPTPRRESASYVGVLAGRQVHETGIARRPVSVRGHEVRVALAGDLATTEVVQTFFNAESAQLEAEYKARVPAGAIVSGFAVDSGSGFIEGSIVPMASDGYRVNFMNVGQTTARLSYDGEGRVRAHVYPIEAGQTVRVKLRYTQWLSRRGSRRSYTYPMVDEGVSAPLIGELHIEVNTTGQRIGAYRAGMGATVAAGIITLRRNDYRPSADFHVEFVDAPEAAVPTAAAYVVTAPGATDTEAEDADGEDRFVFFDMPTADLDLPESSDAPLELVLVADVSGATETEDLELASGVVETVLRQLAPTDRVTLLLGDVGAHPSEGADAGLAPANAETRERLLESLANAPLGGATDLATTLRQAATLVAGRPRGAVLYLGDGIPTTGALDTSTIRRSLATLEGAPRLFALGIGQGANHDLLRLLADHSEAVEDRTQAARAVMRILAEAARPMLRDLRLDLGQNVERVYPRPPLALPVDAALRVSGRLRGPLPEEVTLMGSRDGEAFEVSFPVRRATIDDGGDIRRRWAQARLRELLDEDAGREALVELGTRFGLLTPWTSFSVYASGAYLPIQGFDPNPRVFLGTFAAGGANNAGGWRRRRGEESDRAPSTVAESTWIERVAPEPEGASGGPTESGLARASVARTLREGERGPRACYERRLITRPDLAGVMRLTVEVGGDGTVRDAKVDADTLSAADVRACVLTEIRGLRFPSLEGSSVSVSHTFQFAPSTAIGVRNQCSDASRQALSIRANLWRERLAANSGVGGAVSVYGEARRQCELDGWRARRTLLDLILRHVGGVAQELVLYRSLSSNAAVRGYLRRAILRHVRTARDLALVRASLGLEAPVDWRVFSRLWNRAGSADAKLRLVRRWLEVLPDEMSLRLHLLALLEETGAIDEARRLARELRADPLADARVLTAVGEFLLRQEDEAGARRVFSELVEFAPYDPWARRRLGDLYRAHGWFDDAYREYGSLARLVPDSPDVLLLLAMAAAGAGRTDEALRLEQRVADSSSPEQLETIGGVARLSTTFRLAQMQRATEDAEMLRAIGRRKREAGVLRDAPAVLIGLRWTHPEDSPTLHLHVPSTPEDMKSEPADIQAAALGILAQAIPQFGSDESAIIEVRRADEDRLRDVQGQLIVVVGLGSDEESVLVEDIVLSRETRVLTFELDHGALRSRGALPR